MFLFHPQPFDKRVRFPEQGRGLFFAILIRAGPFYKLSEFQEVLVGLFLLFQQFFQLFFVLSAQRPVCLPDKKRLFRLVKI